MQTADSDWPQVTSRCLRKCCFACSSTKSNALVKFDLALISPVSGFNEFRAKSQTFADKISVRSTYREQLERKPKADFGI